MRVLLALPPMTQLNGPYPSTSYLLGFLRAQGVDAAQVDLAIGLALRLFSPEGLDAVRDAWPRRRLGRLKRGPTDGFLEQFDAYRAAIGPAVRFLQGKDPSLAHRIAGRRFLPEGPRFAPVDDARLAWAFGALGVHDRARHLATLFLEDVVDAIRTVDPRLELVRYGERLAASEGSFDALADALDAPPTVVDDALDALAAAAILRHRPQILGVSAPFPGNAYGAFRIARAAKRIDPSIVTVLGGGWPSTELRELAEPRVFDAFDHVVLDAGEAPLAALIRRVATGAGPLRRTFSRVDGRVVFEDDPTIPDVPFAATGTPTAEGLRGDDYLCVLDLLNPMHRLWSDQTWNKLTIAHGCYWKKCSFCDTSLDYIRRFDPAGAAVVVDRMAAMIAETGRSGFHFVDEAAPPAQLRAVADELLRRRVVATWWGNIRFEKAFTPELCARLAEAGCVAVTGGLEVASDRLLAKMNKGVTVAQVARVGRAFADAGVLVHAYLMYGFPTQTVQETVDSLELVRQLFANGCLHSGYWHRFAATVHAPVGRDPAAFGVTTRPLPFAGFARNDLWFDDGTGVDHDALGTGLNAALYNYLHGHGLDEDVRAWFPDRVPKPKVDRRFIAAALAVDRP